MPAKPTVIVIGSGLGGLAATARLAHQGYSVTVLERNATGGGKMQQVVSPNGYRFDAGPTLLTMPAVFEDLFHSCGKNISDYLMLVPLESSCRYFFSDGLVFDGYCDLKKLRTEIAAKFPTEQAAFEKYLAYAKKIYDATSEAFIYNPLTLRRLLSINPLDFFKIDSFRTAHAANAAAFTDRRLVQFLDRFPTYVGSSPYLAPATLNVIPFVELAFGGFYVKGGIYEVAKAYKRLCDEAGVTFKFNSDVKTIRVQNGKVTGVELTSGETLNADAVISNDDAVHTMEKLLGQKTPKHLEASCSGFVLLLGVRQTHERLGHHNIFFSSDYETEFDDIFTKRVPPSEPTIYISVSAKSDIGQAPSGCENWFVLINAPYLSEAWDWEKEKTTYRNLVIARLEKLGFENLNSRIEFEKIFTPLDLQLKFNANKGSIYGITSNNRLAAFLRPQNKSGSIKGLYFASGSSHPGGGTPMVTLAGKFAAELLMADFGN
jgi:phytoene desaturase